MGLSTIKGASYMGNSLRTIEFIILSLTYIFFETNLWIIAILRKSIKSHLNLPVGLSPPAAAGVMPAKPKAAKLAKGFLATYGKSKRDKFPLENHNMRQFQWNNF